MRTGFTQAVLRASWTPACRGALCCADAILHGTRQLLRGTCWPCAADLRDLPEPQRLTAYQCQILADDSLVLDVALKVAAALAYLHSRAQVIVHQVRTLRSMSVSCRSH